MRDEGRESFEGWARAHQQRLVRGAFLLTGDYQRAEDLVQDALIGVAMRWNELRDGNPDAWVRTVVYRKNVSWWRRHRRETVVERVPEVAMTADDRTDDLRSALAALTRQQRAVVVLRYAEDLSVAETASILGVTEGTVKKHTSIALQRLRLMVPQLEETPEERP